MFHRNQVRVILVHSLALLAILPKLSNSLIITSVLAGDKKFKTISFDSKFLKPLTFEKEMPLTEFRRHRTVRPPKFDIDINIPIKLPVEEEYPYEEPKKPVVSNIFLQTDEIHEPSYPKKDYPAKQKPIYYKDEMYSSSSDARPVAKMNPGQVKVKPNINTSPEQINFQPQIQQFQPMISQRSAQQHQVPFSQPRSDDKDLQSAAPEPMTQASSNYGYSSPKGYGYQEHTPDFVPGGFVNLQLSGPQGGPKMTYEDYDREKWAQQLSQTPGAMPYPILNYHQLQNYYGGLGTFTNGLAENRYMQHTILDKIKTHINQLANKIYYGV